MMGCSNDLLDVKLDRPCRCRTAPRNRSLNEELVNVVDALEAVSENALFAWISNTKRIQPMMR
jgi:hypothetical protein